MLLFELKIKALLFSVYSKRTKWLFAHKPARMVLCRSQACTGNTHTLCFCADSLSQPPPSCPLSQSTSPPVQELIEGIALRIWRSRCIFQRQ
jgi:hypothetical protein